MHVVVFIFEGRNTSGFNSLGDKPRVFSSGDRLLQHEDMGTGHNDNFLSSLKKFP